MLHSLQIVTCVLLMQGLYTVDVLATDGCANRLTASLKDGTDTCLAMTDYVKCILLASNAYKEPNNDEAIGRFKRKIETKLAEKGFNCDIDVKAIVEELLEDDRKGIVRTTTRPTGYNQAKTVGDCSDTVVGEIEFSRTCASQASYIKCLIRVYNSNNQDSQTLAQTHKDRLNKLYIECDIKLSSLIEEVRREQGVDSGSSRKQGNGDNESSRKQGHGENGADMVAGSYPCVTLLILTCASVFLLHQMLPYSTHRFQCI